MGWPAALSCCASSPRALRFRRLAPGELPSFPSLRSADAFGPASRPGLRAALAWGRRHLRPGATGAFFPRPSPLARQTVSSAAPASRTNPGACLLDGTGRRAPLVAGDELRKDSGEGTGPGLCAYPTGRPEEGSESRNPVGFSIASFIWRNDHVTCLHIRTSFAGTASRRPSDQDRSVQQLTRGPSAWHCKASRISPGASSESAWLRSTSEKRHAAAFYQAAAWRRARACADASDQRGRHQRIKCQHSRVTLNLLPG